MHLQLEILNLCICGFLCSHVNQLKLFSCLADQLYTKDSYTEEEFLEKIMEVFTDPRPIGAEYFHQRMRTLKWWLTLALQHSHGHKLKLDIPLRPLVSLRPC